MIAAKPIENRPWSESEIKDLRRRSDWFGDSVSDTHARKAARGGRGAYWNNSSHHAASYTVAADKANMEGLHAACTYLDVKLAMFGNTPEQIRDLIAAFLDRLAPVNETGCEARAAAYEHWCGTFLDGAPVLRRAA